MKVGIIYVQILFPEEKQMIQGLSGRIKMFEDSGINPIKAKELLGQMKEKLNKLDGD